ncbi:hypothetical protein BO993_21950 [Xanthomonas oryzae pv. oryzae]|nr:hypothetical protein BO993_21950 [Xanthomonas oryzae pv. oryzae]QEJ68384.1 hypothetical protein BXO1_008450 [Xanthomonas oryzae pv. oryzae]
MGRREGELSSGLMLLPCALSPELPFTQFAYPLRAARMGIQKQEFYEGAALHQLIRGSSRLISIQHSPPLFVFGSDLQIYLKYSTAKRSPWAFTFMPEEQVVLRQSAQKMPLVIGLICGADGVAALPYEAYVCVAQMKSVALRVSCKRSHRKHFEIGGPDGILPNKVAPSDWVRLLEGAR